MPEETETIRPCLHLTEEEFVHYHSLLPPNKRFSDNDVSKAGESSLIFIGVPAVEHMPTGYYNCAQDTPIGSRKTWKELFEEFVHSFD